MILQLSKPRRSIVSSRTPLVRARRTGNMLLSGGGAETLQDRGSRFTASQHTLNPYFNNNFLARWQEYIRWYMTAWEARKIIDIPVEDALRNPAELRGLEDADKKDLERACENFKLRRQMRRALTQERLLGGACILPIFMRDENEKTSAPLNLRSLRAGDLRALNVVDVSKLARPTYDTDPFSEGYDHIERLSISGTEVHHSRLCLLDGSPLLNRGSQTVLENFRFNPCGFGESKLATLYDLLNRVVGTQQGAFHLVNMASCLLIEAENIRTLQATDNPALAKLQEIIEQISLYRGAIVDAKGAKISQHSASFGSVPELVMTFAQLLSAASDIPATRFLGQAPGGLNATGESDLENYYNMIAAFVQSSVMPVERQCLDWIGANLWGWETWAAKSRDLELHYPPLWNLSETDKATVDNTYATLLKGLYDSGIIDAENVVNELLERKIFITEVEAAEFLEDAPSPPPSPFGGGDAASMGAKQPFARGE